jgi:hypothetical protein
VTTRLAKCSEIGVVSTSLSFDCIIGFVKGDIIPLPCNVERVAVTYMARSEKDKFIHITRND